jgi:opacity protein-like surface antigen
MRTLRRTGLALLIALAFSVPVFAQDDDRVTFNAAVGPSFANVGTTFSTTAGLDIKLNDRAMIVGEFGLLPHAPFRDASEIAPAVPAVGPDSPRVNAYHWNGNLKVRPFTVGKLESYVTGGIGSFTADTVVNDRMIGTTRFEDHRRATDFASNVGAGIGYRFNDWVGIGADYRTFFVHRDDTTPKVNRFAAGLTLSLK